MMNIIFFGSTADSVIVCDSLYRQADRLSITIQAVVTQPAKPIGRKQVITPTPVERWAHDHSITCHTFETLKDKPWMYQDEKKVIGTLSSIPSDLLISASYGQKIPAPLIASTPMGGINIHPSLLPRWRGTDPVPWTILAGDTETGVTVVTLTEHFDTGLILAQQKVPVPPDKSPQEIRALLFTLGSALLPSIITDYRTGTTKGVKQDKTLATYARRLTRDDGFIPWNTIRLSIAGDTKIPTETGGIFTYSQTPLPESIAQAVRALSPWPGIWTIITTNSGHTPQGKREEKRMKILTVHITNGRLVVDTVQMEGKKPAPFTTVQIAYGLALDKPNV
jgi:methionyl-tRNA formyltransferase